MNENAGKVLKEIRESKSISQKEATGEVCTPATLSNYENGKSDIAFGILYGILNNIGLSVSEFEYIVNGYKGSAFYELMKEVSELYRTGKGNALIDFMKNYNKTVATKRDRMVSLMLKNMASKLGKGYLLSELEKDEVNDYFIDIPRWCYFEIVLFTNLMNAFEPRIIVIQCEEMLAKTRFYESIPENKQMVITAMLNAIGVLTEHDLYDDVIKLKQTTMKLLDEKDLLNRTEFLFLEGLLDVEFGKEEGYQKMEDAIDVYRKLKCQNSLERHLINYNGIVEYYKEK